MRPDKGVWPSGYKQRLKDELLLRGYSAKTIKAYSSQIERFLAFSGGRNGGNVLKSIKPYTLSMMERGCSHAHVNQALSAIKFYCQTILQQHDATCYVRPKKESKLPHVLSLQEVMLVLRGTHNLKHRAILYITYSAGLRVGEVVRLRIQDFDEERRTLRIRQGKGRKDRYTLLSDTALEVVRHYYALERPDF